MNFKNIAIVADKRKEAQQAAKLLKKKYGFCAIGGDSDIDLIIALGGDGLMLHSLHKYMARNIPIYGMNRGTIGFLMNDYHQDDLMEKISEARITKIHPLKMQAERVNGDISQALAINEVSLMRKSGQAAKIKISIDGVTHIEETVCDGVLVSTPAGSSAYNFSIGGPVLPIKSKLLALTPISPFRPRRWRGAILPHSAKITFDITASKKRPVNATADFHDFEDVVSVSVKEDSTNDIQILFDRGHSLEERILHEQFAY